MNSISEYPIVLVDDDPFFLGVCEQYLLNIGYEHITQYQSSTTFLQDFKPVPQLILLDYEMDSLNGIETLKKIKRLNPNAIVVFISAQENIAVAVNALKYGAFDYLIKSQITQQKLEAIIEKTRLLAALVEKKSKKGFVRKMLNSMTTSSTQKINKPSRNQLL